jgi:hypothetical protein
MFGYAVWMVMPVFFLPGCKAMLRIRIPDMINLLRMPEKNPLQENRKKSRLIRVVSRLSRGNVLLQSGRYQTAADIEMRATKLKNYRFVE